MNRLPIENLGDSETPRHDTESTADAGVGPDAGTADSNPHAPETQASRLNQGVNEMMGAVKALKRLQNKSAPLLPINRGGRLPLSFSQERLWMIHQLAADVPAYNTARAWHVQGPLNLTALEQGLLTIVQRHEILRAAFPALQGHPHLQIHPAWEPGLQIVDLSDSPPSNLTEFMPRLNREVRRPFDLAQGPVFRATVFQWQPQEFILLLVSHHIVLDERSWAVLNRELSALYTAHAEGGNPRLAELPVQYVDFAHWQRHWMQGEVLQIQLDFWKKELGSQIQLLDLPADHPRPPVESFQCDSRRFCWSPALSRAIKELSRQEGVTLFTILLAGLYALLHAYTRQDDILVFSPAAGRNRPETQKLIGLFSNFLGLRTHLSPDGRIRDLFNRVSQSVLGAFAHQGLPFEQLIEGLQWDRRDLSRSLFQVLFIFRNSSQTPLQLAELELTPLEVDNGRSKFDLHLFVEETEQGLAGSLTYKTELFDSNTGERMLDDYRQLLEAVVAKPDLSIGELTSAVRPPRAASGSVPPGPAVSATVHKPEPEKKSAAATRDSDIQEVVLTQIWEQIFGFQGIGVTDNFFELGGNSLLAMRLIQQVQEIMGKDLPLTALLQAPTIEQLSAWLRNQGPANPRSPVVAIHPQGEGSPLYWLHGITGNTFHYYTLTRYLAPGRPVYGLQAPADPMPSIEAMAQHHLGLLLNHHPKGPYYLGGYCFGGVVAYELACQLQAAGHQVAFLALLESFNPRWRASQLKWSPRTLFHGAVNSPYWMMEFARDPRKYGARFRRKGAQVFAPLEIDYATEGGQTEMSGYWKLHKQRVEIHERALKQYHPKPYQGRLHLFRSRRTLALTHMDPDLGWRSLATRGVKVHWVRGHHGTILYEPYVPHLARKFKACLQSLSPCSP